MEKKVIEYRDVDKEKIVDRFVPYPVKEIVEVKVPVEKNVETVKNNYIEVPKIVEKPVYIDKIVNVPYKEYVEVPVYCNRI